MAQTLAINRSGQSEALRRKTVTTSSPISRSRTLSTRREAAQINGVKKEAPPSANHVPNKQINKSNLSTSDNGRLHHQTYSTSNAVATNRLQPDLSSPSINNRDKFSKYSPLPAIRSRPSLKREKTYDVLEPVFVKGPQHNPPVEAVESHMDNRVKLPEIRLNRLQQTSKTRKTSQVILTSAPPSKNDQLLRVPPSVTSPQSGGNGSVRQKANKLRQPFNPNHISNASMPESPTVFWFPA